MRQKSGPEKQPAEETIKDIRRATRRHFSAEEKIRVVLEGLRGEESIAELRRREGIASAAGYAGAAGMWIAGTSSTSALTPNAQRSNLTPLSSTLLHRRRDRAETPGLIGRGFLHFVQAPQESGPSFLPRYG